MEFIIFAVGSICFAVVFSILHKYVKGRYKIMFTSNDNAKDLIEIVYLPLSNFYVVKYGDKFLGRARFDSDVVSLGDNITHAELFYGVYDAGSFAEKFLEQHFLSGASKFDIYGDAK